MCVCVCVGGGAGWDRERQTDREKEAFQLGKQGVLWPCGRRPMEHVGEWDSSQCGWSLERERRLEVRPVARL